ncbi:hypothetical protein [Shewanella algae]|uniref:hypothetical protein n=1 Tax=Shewanella algae TaxID=38313 RepID=UPI000B8A7D39|nr:hypothetical protein [Shewanella algae]OXS00728.1 hypothetical protein AMR44_11340 [Shewanella algae]
MYDKNKYIDENQSVIEKEYKEVMEIVLKDLKKNGCHRGHFNFNCSGGVIIEVTNKIKRWCNENMWTFEFQADPFTQSLKLEIY